MTSVISGKIYKRYSAKAEPALGEKDHELISGTVSSLINKSDDHPGMLLGNIQSGKTRTFVGIIAMAFDNGFDVAIVFTKNSLALAKQTTSRITRDLYEDGVVEVNDIKFVNGNVDGSDQAPKLVLIVKKEDDNIRQLISLFKDENNALLGRRVLVVDDEADITSVGYKHAKEGGIKLQKVHALINEFRQMLRGEGAGGACYLQVTATPYALYLQSNHPGQSHLSVRPVFTRVIEPGPGYVGTDYFFGDTSRHADFAVSLIPGRELAVLDGGKKKRKAFANPLGIGFKQLPGDRSPKYNLTTLRGGLIGFIVAATIRMIQDGAEVKGRRYAFIVHTDTGMRSHDRQNEIVRSMVEQIRYFAKHDPSCLTDLFETAYDEIEALASSHSVKLPDRKLVFKDAISSLVDRRRLSSTVINSDEDAASLFDEQKGELKKSHPMTVFIGGNILDRGLTITNLIGFYYGRNPGKAQQDTVLQHMRILGYRSRADLAVTRMFCSEDTREALQKIHQMDQALRQRLKEKPEHRDAVFVSYDPSGKVVPCPPNKLLPSRTTTYYPESRDLPVGFHTSDDAATHVSRVEAMLQQIGTWTLLEKGVQVPVETAQAILSTIQPSLIPDSSPQVEVTKKKRRSKWSDTPFVWEHASAAIQKMSLDSEDPEQRGRVWIIARGFSGPMREIARLKKNGTAFSDAPDTSKGDTDDMRKKAKHVPGIILLKQAGRSVGEDGKLKGWSDQPFIWPVVISPQKMKDPIIFAHELRNPKAADAS